MKARLLGGLACATALLAGAPWWACLAALLGFLVPGRLAPVAGTVTLLAFLPGRTGPAATDLLHVATGMLAASACLARLGRATPWVALPYFGAAAILLAVLWPILPPDQFWTDADVSARARITVLAALALVGTAATYRPRYRNDAPDLAATADGASGTVGGRDETR